MVEEREECVKVEEGGKEGKQGSKMRDPHWCGQNSTWLPCELYGGRCDPQWFREAGAPVSELRIQTGVRTCIEISRYYIFEVPTVHELYAPADTLSGGTTTHSNGAPLSLLVVHLRDLFLSLFTSIEPGISLPQSKVQPIHGRVRRRPRGRRCLQSFV